MDPFRFIFSFLYIRDWHTGEQELSRPRVTVFAVGLFMIVLGLLIVSFLQAPVTYKI